MSEIWLTVTEIARRLGRPASTVAYWRNTYRPPPGGADERGHALYRLAAFEQIAVLVRRKTPPAEIRRVIAGDDTPLEGYEVAVLAELRAIRAAVERIADRLESAAPEAPPP